MNPPDHWRHTAEAAARRIHDLTGRDHQVAVVLGSGWAGAAASFAQPIDVPWSELPGFSRPAALGHVGSVRSMTVDGAESAVLAFLGRSHFYESRDPFAATHAIRTAAAVGCRSVVLTNGCGTTREDWPPGTIVAIRDHINLSAASPLVGAQFVDLSEVYSPRLRSLVAGIDPHIPEGVYAQVPGPQYETPAEVGMIAGLGAELIGMSTVLEAIAARECGLDVLALSLVTNLAAGLTDGVLSHAEVLDTGRGAAERCSALLQRVLSAVTSVPSSSERTNPSGA
jgi:purine-nucleoside phosphorylase